MTIFWDWNGTIVDDVDLVVKVNNMVFAQHGYRDTSAEEYRRLFRFPVREYYYDLGVTPEDFVVIAKEWNVKYVENFSDASLARGVLETLRRFKAAGFRQVIISASQVNQLRDQVKSFPELEGMFDEVLGLSDVYAVSKVQLAQDYLARSGVNPCEAVFLGDTNHDAEVAQAIGCRCFLISGGHQEDAVLAKAPDAQVLGRIEELYPILGV